MKGLPARPGHGMRKISGPAVPVEFLLAAQEGSVFVGEGFEKVGIRVVAIPGLKHGRQVAAENKGSILVRTNDTCGVHEGFKEEQGRACGRFDLVDQ